MKAIALWFREGGWATVFVLTCAFLPPALHWLGVIHIEWPPGFVP